jgi:exopolyphosphatase/guanosine-5'-triphosphate,3'-diphosphate pyrophosphatase
MNIASIDIGTNTVLMLIANISKDDKTIKPLLNEYRMPRIGKGLIPGGEINSDSIVRLFDVLEIYADIIKKYNCEKVIAKGTSALRLASNSSDIINKIKVQFGIEVEIISGTEEARLSYLGSISAFNSTNNIVIDIGGGSTEVIFGTNKSITYSKSFEAGAVNLTENLLKNDPPSNKELEELFNRINNVFAKLKNRFPSDALVIAVAGTPTSLSCIKQGLTVYDEEKVEGSFLYKDELHDFVSHLSKMSHSEIKSKYQEIVSGRDDIILAGTAILFLISEILNVKDIAVSGRGIRFGSIIDYLDKL